MINFEPSKNIYIFADPRSGSTWLAEMLSNIEGYCLVDEIFHLKHSKELSASGFAWRQYIPEEAQWTEIEAIVGDLLKAKSLSSIHLMNNSVYRILKAKQGVYKIIRGKLFLPWFCKTFAPSYKPINLRRNPMSFIASIESHNAWNYPYQRIEKSDDMFGELIDQHFDFLNSLNTNYEQILSYWCLGNKYLDDNYKGQWINIDYDLLLLNPEESLNAILNEWKLNIEMPYDSFINIPSKSSSNSTPEDPETRINKWKNQMSQSKIKRYQEILDYFKIVNL